MRNDERLRTIYEVMAPYIVRNEHNWRDYLAFASQFHKHSFDNILLVYAQDEDVSILATRKQWAAISSNRPGLTSVRTAARPATSILYALTYSALTSRKTPLCWKMMRLMNPRQCSRKAPLRMPVMPLIPHLGNSLPLCQQRIPTPLQMALKPKSGGNSAARFVCGLGGSPFLYPLEPYR